MSKPTINIILAAVIVALAISGGTTVAGRTEREAAPAQAPAATQTPLPVETNASAAKPPVEPEPDVIAAPEPTPEPEPEYYSFHFVGDCTLACNAYYQGGPLGYDTVIGTDYAYPFAKTIQYFRDDDFTFANLEVALTES
ncbi:MAG: hypothetical protein IJ705_03285, partial [Oscillospiraceae bacterium]|nr:hypothetical protein [Oscillospiraceae bacterium]